ncbi:ArnT family glycosyltransferase [Paludibacterium paludis]|uniref:Phospholipid carrier-dependent glycosyltransferase n=1 Tax=Paludibacterium paludis TaxID=1225769 RepID=A0A918NWV3_9NEIS|nr:glycosyltransferase family 39 protein [Paludibacterium paludis]GGY03314.1 phospholipid carrier-dependent glycosyltransferase [Paludibacterium paludis]
MNQTSRPYWQRQGMAVLGALLIARLAAMILIPLTDTTEARYAEIARKMLETGNWITLWHDYGVPFWAKPPLSTWFSALSMGLFGVNELAARLPSLLLSAGTVALVARLLRKRYGGDAGWASALLLAGGILFLLGSGTVMTDPALIFATTLIHVAFWEALDTGKRAWGYLFFAGIGLGLLAKGPIAIVLTAMPIGLWVILNHRWAAIRQHLPWLTGTLLALAIAVPWYWLAERRTPGFLDYFIVGEHISRFLDPGWKGDRYGYAHATPHGMIWLYAAAGLLPWSVCAPVWLVRFGRRLVPDRRDGFLSYCVLWTTMPLVFFTVSGNIIMPYALTMVPGFAALAASLWARHDAPERGRWLPWLAALPLVALIAATLAFRLAPEPLARTQKAMVGAWFAERPAANSRLVLWDSRREFSAEFYAGGRLITTFNPQTVRKALATPGNDYLACRDSECASLPAELRAAFVEAGRFPNPGEAMRLLKKRAPATPLPLTGPGNDR